MTYFGQDTPKYGECETVCSDCIRVGEYKMEYALIKSGCGAHSCYSVFISVSAAGYHDELTVHGVSSVHESALGIYETLKSGAVTPMTARDVIEDIL